MCRFVLLLKHMAAPQPSTKALKQLGWCETCGDPAYASRWAYEVVLKTINGVLTYITTRPVEHYMCMRHKAHYFRFMEAKRKELEQKRKGARAHKDS